MKYWPFSLAGTVLLFLSVLVLGTALPRGQEYGIFLSLFILIYLTAALVRVVIIAFRFEKDHFQWRVSWNFAPPRGKGNHIQLSAPSPAPLGIRYSFRIRGILYGGDRPLYSKRSEKVFVQNTAYSLELPLPGLFRCEGRLFLSDLFGLLRLPLTGRENREILYHPPLLAERSFPSPRAAEENKENIKNNPSSPEKVLMREYQPGDLVRDINWKASGKFSAIYTRISPDQEHILSRMTLVIRPEGTAEAGEPVASALLLGLKSLGATVFHSLRKDHPESLLEIIVGERTFSSESDKFDESFPPFLSSLGAKNMAPLPDLPEGALILTTTADRDLRILKERAGERVFVCSCSSGGGKDVDFSLFQGNSLPRGELLKGILRPGRVPSPSDRVFSVETGVLP